MTTSPPGTRTVGVATRLGVAQTLAWASSYYLPAMLAQPLAADLGLAPTRLFAAFTLALIVSAAVGPRAGRAIDEWGGRTVLLATNALFALGLGTLALAQAEWQVWLAWAVIGLAMGSGLYDAAFATLVRLYPAGARDAITGVTLIAGFASTVGWPLTAWWVDAWGWRGACGAWAVLHLVLGAPLNALLPGRASPPGPVAVPTDKQPVAASAVAPSVVPSAAPTSARKPPSRAVAVAVSAVFAVAWFGSTAMATHLPALLQSLGLGAGAALAVAMWVGPAQVAGRLLEFGWLRRVHPLWSARWAALAHPVGVLGLAVWGPAAAWLFAGLHGAGNGILTIAKGTLPLALFGPAGYGERQGWLMAPARLAQALAPLLFGLAMAHWGAGALWLTAGLGLLALALLQWIAWRSD